MLHKSIENPLVPRVKQFLNVATKKPPKNNDNIDMKKDQQRAI